jgi:hypothetical protein
VTGGFFKGSDKTGCAGVIPLDDDDDVAITNRHCAGLNEGLGGHQRPGAISTPDDRERTR